MRCKTQLADLYRLLGRAWMECFIGNFSASFDGDNVLTGPSEPAPRPRPRGGGGGGGIGT